MTSHILIVEDEPALKVILEAAMKYGGFDHTSVSSGGEALALLRIHQFDAVLLDLGLPDVDGKALLRTLRSFSDVAIIICSGRATEAEKVEALDLGADDFIPKPFLPAEMLARIRAVLRRRSARGSGGSESVAGQPSRPEILTIDPHYPIARFGDHEVSLTEAECKVLRLLLEGRTGPISKSSILAELYGEGEERETKIVEIYLMRLRRKLEELTGRDDLIQNLRGRGWFIRMDS